MRVLLFLLVGASLVPHYCGFRIPRYQESNIALTSLAQTRDAGPWFWAPSVGNVACGIQLMGVYSYDKLPHLREGTDRAELTGYSLASGGGELFRDVKCAVRTAWQYADEKFGKDQETASFAVACVVTLDEEIGPMTMRSVHETGKICRVLASSDVHLVLHIHSNATTTTTSAPPSPTLVQFQSRASQPVKKRGHLVESAEFVVCGVQSFRNTLTPYLLPMWAQHYSSLGFRVAIFDRSGLHADVIASGSPSSHSSSPSSFSAGPIDYFPFTMLDQAMGRNASKESQKDFSYKVYYREHLKAAQGIAPKATLEKNTGLLDREKVVTYDHCRLLYAQARGVLFVDTDEFLFCPSVPNSYAAQGDHQLQTLHKLADEGVDEIRLDTYPYDTSSSLPSSDIAALHACLKRAAAASARGVTGAAAAADSKRGPYWRMHQCFSSRSTYPTWMKSADLGRRCPFHYNHWSCDGGKGGGRNLQCRCRVSIAPWMSFTHAAQTQACHLMHYNPQQYAYQTGRNRPRKDKDKLSYDASLKANVSDSPLATIRY